MRDAFNNKRFNSYLYPAELQGVPDDGMVELYVSGIPPSLTETGLINLMSSVADIRRVTMIPHKNIGFVTVRRRDAYKVISHFNNYSLGAVNYLSVKLSKPKRPPVPPTSGAANGRSSAASGEVEQHGRLDQASGARFPTELKIPALSYPSAAKYVQVGQELAATVLNIISPSQFWISHHPYDAEDQLKDLHDKMQNHYSGLVPKRGFKQNMSSLYAARSSSSGQWCRVQALSCDTESVKVLLLDYGTCEQVGLANLHSLEGQFCSLAFRAICCSLAHVEGTPRWSQEAVDCMQHLVSNEPVSVRVCSIDGYLLGIELILSSSSQSVGDCLVARNHARYVKGFERSSAVARADTAGSGSASVAESSEDSVTDYPTVKDLSRTQLKVGERYDVVLLHARNAADVTVCLNADIGKLGTLLTELNSYEFSEEPYAPHVGEIVAARYEDGSCCRAEVLSVDNDTTAAVRFLDYGNMASVNLKSVVQLQPRHIAFPVYGINIRFRCSDDDSKLLLEQEYSQVNVKVVEQHGNQYVVSLAEDSLALSPSSQCIYSITDITQRCLEAGKTYKAWVTDAVDVEAFYVQVPEFDYFAINEQLQTIYGSSSGSYEPQQPGELIAVCLVEDRTWCRAVVKEIAGKGVQCQLVDFGMSVSTTSQYIRRIDSRLLSHPIAAFKCSFYDVVGSGQDRWMDEYLRPMMGVYNMTVIEVKDDMHFVELADVESAVDWKQKLIDGGFLVKAGSKDLQSSESAVEQVPSVSDGRKPGDSSHGMTSPSVCGSRQAEIKSSHDVVTSQRGHLHSLSDDEVRQLFNNRERIVVVHANSPSDFYIQPGSDDARKKLVSLHQSINSFCMLSSSCELDTGSTGQIVGVLHDDGIWHRGEIVSLESAGKFVVDFVDVGISKTVESGDLRLLPDDLAFSLPRYAIPCAIERVVGCEPDGSWSAAAVERFQKFCASRDFALKLIHKSDSGSSWLVDLLHAAGITAKDMLLAQKLAQQRTGSSSKSTKSTSQRSPRALPHTSVEEVKPLPLVSSSQVADASIQANDTVTVTCIHSPCNFFIRHELEASASVMKELNSHCKAQDRLYHPGQVGELVGVMQNSQWHRAEVLSLDTHSANVFLIDYGASIDNVDFKDVRSLPLHFATILPKLAVCCAIGGLSGTGRDGSYVDAAATWFADNYLQVPSVVIKVKDADPSGPLLINLKNSKSNKNARQSLLDYGMAVASTPAASDRAASTPAHSSLSVTQPSSIPKPHAESPVTTPREHAHAGSTPAYNSPPIIQPSSSPKPHTESPVTTPGERAHFEEARALQEYAVVSIVHANSPADFYVIPSDASSLREFMLLSQKLAEFCGTAAGYRPRHVGEPVAAMYGGEWFRAEVVKLMPNDDFKVFFVDYGNTDVVGSDDVRSLPEEFVKWPKQAVHCGIDGICGTDGGYEFSAMATMSLLKFCCDSCATLSSVRIADTKHLVNISVGDDNAKELLIGAGFARLV